MTADELALPPTAASKRGRANRRKGHQAERDLCRWLRNNGFGGAERAVRTGYRTGERVGADPGDITGTPGIVWSVKDCAVEELGKWMVELESMRAADNAALSFLVHKRRGHADPGRWWCWAPMDMWVWIAGIPDPDTPAKHRPELWQFPARAELRHAVQVVRELGYGDPLEHPDLETRHGIRKAAS